MNEFGRLLLFIGLGLAAAGLIILVGARFFPWLGKLPGDITYEGENTKVFIPITTMILVSVIGTILLNLILRVFRD
jgi:hypothetical protein